MVAVLSTFWLLSYQSFYVGSRS